MFWPTCRLKTKVTCSLPICCMTWSGTVATLLWWPLHAQKGRILVSFLAHKFAFVVGLILRSCSAGSTVPAPPAYELFLWRLALLLLEDGAATGGHRATGRQRPAAAAAAVGLLLLLPC